jgi:hypothetical protein
VRVLWRPIVFFGSMPRTAFSTAATGRAAIRSLYLTARIPPGNPECRYAYLSSPLFPVSSILSALTTTTWSPVSMCGAYIGLCLPRRIVATSEASLPSTTPLASTTYQRRSMCSGFGE